MPKVVGAVTDAAGAEVRTIRACAASVRTIGSASVLRLCRALSTAGVLTRMPTRQRMAVARTGTAGLVRAAVISASTVSGCVFHDELARLKAAARPSSQL